ncbi:hypothetical protein T07_13621 [Trichinella nelsoni]|uniref:Uncharacterized protein n=1 Tax=Trichinella nelsoni TaxID=6336 RepID=A0A0V0S0D7_9BILA|nr:hypothetical protein T07_13621 [Trichinella nelsoni]
MCISDKMQISYITVIFEFSNRSDWLNLALLNMNIEVKKTVNAEETKLNADNTKHNNRREQYVRFFVDWVRDNSKGRSYSYAKFSDLSLLYTR